MIVVFELLGGQQVISTIEYRDDLKRDILHNPCKIIPISKGASIIIMFVPFSLFVDTIEVFDDIHIISEYAAPDRLARDYMKFLKMHERVPIMSFDELSQPFANISDEQKLTIH